MKNTLLQLPALLTMVYGGIVTGIAYDALRLLRRLFPTGFVCVLCDMLFVILAVCITAVFLLAATGGELRAYTMFGLLAGFAAEQYSISALFFSLLHRVLTIWTKSRF